MFVVNLESVPSRIADHIDKKRLHTMLRRLIVPGLTTLILILVLSAVGIAGEADVVGVETGRAEDGTLTFTVTVLHDDEGWDHYADRFEILAPDGKVLATRVLYHPHVGEQPFTRSLTRVVIPEGMPAVTVRARDSVHGYGGEEIQVKTGDH